MISSEGRHMNNSKTQISNNIVQLVTKASFYLNQANNNLFEAGKCLLEIKKQAKHGEYITAIKQIGIEQRTAHRIMKTTEIFSGKSDILSDLKPSLLYELASPSTPEIVRTQVEQGVVEGKHYTLAEIKQLKAEAKAQAISETTNEVNKRLEEKVQSRTEQWRQQYLQERNKVRDSETRMQSIEAKLNEMEANPPVIEVIPKGYSTIEEAIYDEERQLKETKNELKKAKKQYSDACNHLSKLKSECDTLAEYKNKKKDSLSLARLARKEFETSIVLFARQLSLVDIETMLISDNGNDSKVDGLILQLNAVLTRLKSFQNTINIEPDHNIISIIGAQQ